MPELPSTTNNFNPDDWLEIGKIVAPQGIKGEVRVYPSSDFPERFEQPGQRWITSPDNQKLQKLQLLSGRFLAGKKLYVMRFAEITDRNAAEALRGHKLIVAKSDRQQDLAEDEYHVADLIDVAVYNQLTGEAVGKVSDVFIAGNELLEVKLHPQPETNSQSDRQAQKSKPATVLIPFVREIVPIVDLEAGRIEIVPPPGLLEE